MSNLNTKTNQYNIVIQLNTKPIDFDTRLNRLLGELVCNYAYILHDSDYHKDLTKKNDHLHLILWNCDKRRTFATMINYLSERLNLNPFAISIEKVVSLEGSIQYLIHLNDIEKTQYDVEKIHTNLSCEELDLFIYSPNKAVTFDRLKVLIIQNDRLTDIIENIGISMYRAYRPVIMDMWHDIKGK